MSTDQAPTWPIKFSGRFILTPCRSEPVLDEPPKVGAVFLSMTTPSPARPVGSRSYLAPSYHLGKTADAYPLAAPEQILGGSETSGLWRSGARQGLALSAGADYDPESVGTRSFAVYVIAEEGDRPRRCRRGGRGGSCKACSRRYRRGRTRQGEKNGSRRACLFAGQSRRAWRG